MLKIIFRIAFLGLGLFLSYAFALDAFMPLWYKMSGTTVEGRISGFLAGRNSPSVQRESTGVRKGKRRARRPVFVYPITSGSKDSLEARSSTGALFTFSNYELNETVSVVFSPNNPKTAYIFGFQCFLGAFLCMLLGLYMLRIGLLGRL